MSSPMTASGLGELAVFARRLSVLIGSGVSLVRALSVLEKDSGAKMSEAVRHVRQRIMEGACFHEATGAAPDVFPRNVTVTIRAGEISGTLEEFFLWLASFLERICRLPDCEEKTRLAALVQNGSTTPERADTAAARLLRLSWFFAIFGMSLSAGVPAAESLGTASEMLTDGERAELAGCTKPIAGHEGVEWEKLETLRWLPAFAAPVLQAGTANNSLAGAARMIAEACEAELFCGLSRA